MIEDFYYPGFATQRKTDAVDSGGAENDIWATNLTDLEGCLRELSAKEIVANGQRGVVSSHRFYCDYATDITSEDKLIFDSKTYDVKTVDNPHNIDHFLEVDVLYDETES